ncbi:MAG: hypothetical protein ACP5QT_02705 [Brevinematia bacterium]
MKIFRLIFVALLFYSVGNLFSLPVNRVVAVVGDFPITSYDIEMMEKFMRAASSNPSNKVEPFKELLFVYSLEQIVKDNKKIILPKDEIDKMIENMTNTEDMTNEMLLQRAKLINDFADEMRLQLKKGQMTRALIFYDTRLKEKANQKIDEAEISNFYRENQKAFYEHPKIDIVLVVCKKPENLSLEELERFEKALDEIALRLKKSDDISDLLLKYKKILNYESYSGRTGLRFVFDLYQQGYPEELLAFSLTTKPIPTPKGNLIVKPGFLIGPEKTRFRNSEKDYYFILKLIDRELEKPIPLEKVRAVIEAQLREKKVYEVMRNYIIEKIEKNELNIVLYDDKLQGEYNEFIRR